VLYPHRVGRVERGEGVRKLFERAAEPVVLGVVGGVLERVAPDDLGVAVPVVGFVGGKVDFAEEPGWWRELVRTFGAAHEEEELLLLVVLEFAHHFEDLL
jgi:hypothetical protein